jgi:hypothetical protein
VRLRELFFRISNRFRCQTSKLTCMRKAYSFIVKAVYVGVMSAHMGGMMERGYCTYCIVGLEADLAPISMQASLISSWAALFLK